MYVTGHLQGLPYVCEIFRNPKEDLVRYYACSLALCTHGCPSNEDEDHVVNEICLEQDCTTKECINPCYSYCETPPTSWPARDSRWDDPGGICGKSYDMDLSLEQEELKGCYDIDVDINIWGSDQGWSYITEVYDVMKKLFPDFFYFDSEGLHYELIDDNCNRKREVGNENQYYPGLIFDKIEKLVWYEPRWQRNEWEIKGTGGIFLKSDELGGVIRCIDVPVEHTIIDIFGVEIPTSTDAPGYYSCLLRGGLKIWSDYKEGSDGCGDVWIGISDPGPGTFDLEVTPREKTVRAGEPADFDVKIKNRLGSGSSFFLSISSCSYNEGGDCDSSNLGCDLGCESSFTSSSLEIANGNSDSSTLTLTPIENGKYEITVNARPTAAYGSKPATITLNVVDLSVTLTPYENNVQADKIGHYTVTVNNLLEFEDDFDLSYTCVGDGCTCQFPNGESTFTLQSVGAGSSKDTYIECLSSSVGTYDVTVNAKAVSQGVEGSGKAVLNVFKCLVDKDEISLTTNSPVESGGDKLILTVYGLESCDGVKISFAVNYPDLVFDSCDVPCDGYTNEETKDSFYKRYIANSPGTYTIYAKIDLDGEYIVSDTLDINSPSMDDVERIDPGIVNKCAFNLDSGGCWIYGVDICDQCGDCWGFLGGEGNLDFFGWCTRSPYVMNCLNYFDPQTYMSRGGTYADNSNICCMDPSITPDEYSSGPSGVPCLSPDTNTHHDRTENWWYGSYECYGLGCLLGEEWGVDNSRNTLVKDKRYATFKTFWCNENPDCTGANGGVDPPDSLSSAVCVDGTDAGFPGYRVCKLSPSFSTANDWYTSWQYINVSEDSRPVYGVQLIVYYSIFCGPDLVGASANFDLYLHEKDGSWFKIDSLLVGGSLMSCAEPTSIEWYEIFDITPDPSSQWSWSNIDALLIAFKNADYLTTSSFDAERPAYVDYIGLLTKDSENTPFCTEGNTNDYYRIVDDGKTCYWNLGCSLTGTGWWGSPTNGIGPFIDTKTKNVLGGFICDDCGTCGDGYCKYNDYCYYDVKCTNGGWRGTLIECSGTCTAQGCV